MIGISTPEYFPRLEYMALVQHVDHFVLADTFPYRRHTFHNRTQLRQSEGWHWITIPIFGNRDGAPLHTVNIKTGGRWREKHWRSFLYDYRATMYFEYFEASVRPFFERSWEELGNCTCRSVRLLAEMYGMKTSFERASSLSGSPTSIRGIAEALDANTVVVLQDGGDVSSVSGLDVQTVTYDHPTYRQNFSGFEAEMSAADLIFNYGPEARSILGSGMKSTYSDSTT